MRSSVEPHSIMLSNNLWTFGYKSLVLQIQSLTISKYQESVVLRNFSLKSTMYQRKIDVDMLNAVKSVLADVLSVSPSSEQRANYFSQGLVFLFSEEVFCFVGFLRKCSVFLEELHQHITLIYMQKKKKYSTRPLYKDVKLKVSKLGRTLANISHESLMRHFIINKKLFWEFVLHL